LSHCTKINSKWIKDLNVRPKTLALWEENLEKMLRDTDIGNNLQNRTSIAHKVIARIGKWDFIKLKGFCTTNNTRVKRQPYRVGEKSLPAIIQQGDNIRMYEELKSILQ
jgi:hypothetical protein